MTDKKNEIEEQPGEIEVEGDKEVKKKGLRCPKGFPQVKWDSWSESAKESYLKIIGGDA